MENKQQNIAFETLANLARVGGRPSDWRATPISETQAAKDTCPYRNNGLSRPGWWRKAEPRDSSGRELLQLLDHVARKFEKEDKKYARDSAPSAQSYLPSHGQNLTQWLAELVSRVNVTAGYRQILFGGLKSFLSRFPGRSEWKDLGAPEQRAIKSIVEKLA